MPRGNQLSRQWQLLQLIERPAGIAVDEAAHQLGCTPRTIWRDLKVLQDSGFPVYDERDGNGRRSVWRLQESFKLGLPVKLSLAEIAALLMSHDLLRSGGAGALGPAIGSAFTKIGRVLSRDAIKFLGEIRDTLGVRAFGAKLQAPAAGHVELIQKALLEHHRLDMLYYSLSREETNRRQVDPYHLTLFNGGFYLVGYCHWRKTERIFAVERIRELSVLGVRFEVRAGFNAEEYLKHAWGIIKGEIVPVKVIFSPSVARYIRERLWRPSQKVRELPDGRLELSLRVADTLEVRRWILGYGLDAEVVEPASVREALRQEAEVLARRDPSVRKLLAPSPSAATSPRKGSITSHIK